MTGYLPIWEAESDVQVKILTSRTSGGGPGHMAGALLPRLLHARRQRVLSIQDTHRL